ncbi:MAG: DUF969 domain-containing protein [Anaerolineaceae bacterium]|nr:DUF969 domain-containing protein [Anaerolineaceae bacterium]
MLIKLLGVLIVIIGFAFKLDSILIIVLAMIVTALTGGLGINGMLEVLGQSFVANRAMGIFIVTLLVVGTLERNGLRESAARLIGKVKSATAGKVISSYAVMRVIFAAFNVSFGGVAGFIRPVIMPMAHGAIKAKGLEPDPEHYEAIKGFAAGAENVSWFFGQVLFVGGSGALLVQSTLKNLGYEVNLVDLAKVEIPVAIFAVLVYVIYTLINDKRMMQKYYGGEHILAGAHAQTIKGNIPHSTLAQSEPIATTDPILNPDATRGENVTVDPDNPNTEA